MKTYVKPELYYENFELSEHIASGCSVVMNGYMSESCTKNKDETVTYFAAGTCRRAYDVNSTLANSCRETGGYELQLNHRGVWDCELQWEYVTDGGIIFGS